MIHWTRLDPKEQAFTHFDPDGTVRHFPIGMMNRYAKRKIKPTPTLVEAHVAETLLANAGIEQAKIDSLQEAPFEVRDEPITIIRFRDGKDLVVDGNHRYVTAYLNRKPRIMAYIFKAGSWERFLIQYPDHIEWRQHRKGDPVPEGAIVV